MKNITLLFLCALVNGCATETYETASRPEILVDVEGYAIASCLTMQASPYLKDQGDGWASVIIQRTEVDLDNLISIAQAVKHENSAGKMAIIRVDDAESGSTRSKALPVLYCNEMINTPTVRLAIQNTVTAVLKKHVIRDQSFPAVTER